VGFVRSCAVAFVAVVVAVICGCHFTGTSQWRTGQWRAFCSRATLRQGQPPSNNLGGCSGACVGMRACVCVKTERENV